MSEAPCKRYTKCLLKLNESWIWLTDPYPFKIVVKQILHIIFSTPQTCISEFDLSGFPNQLCEFNRCFLDDGQNVKFINPGQPIHYYRSRRRVDHTFKQ
ncbi:conserved hypothetical protein [Coccidioides posadasii str. Silveira]|uniref:Uncharacterized protein n=1 Tax=Coccidioides posadasii (strain RMSCC 757 / Silveira) TaxID=443226 RepID=E9D3C2_COCPS|nr:conserved hypothetical protein [Coccidioides posadasii str. Silveira]